MAVAFNVPSVHEEDGGDGQGGKNPQQQPPHPHQHHVGASANVSQQVRSSAEHGQQRLVAAFHEILAAYARHAILAQQQSETTEATSPSPACLQCEKLHYLLRLLR